MDYVRITALNMGNVQANPERRASANEALFGMNYAQHLLAAYSTMLGSATAGCGVNFAPGGITSGGERCVSRFYLCTFSEINLYLYF
jgi:hypothetical protein